MAGQPRPFWTLVRRARHDAACRAGTPDDPEADAGRIQAWIEQARRGRARPDDVAQRWLEARADLPRTRPERAQWWTRSRDAYADCEAWAEPDGYPVPPAVVWGTTLTRLGIKSVVKKARGHSVRMRNLRLKPSPNAAG